MKILEPQVIEEGYMVWGSNEVGRSFSGAAKTAVDSYGAELGVGFGFTGQSFAIPTKDANLKPLPLRFIKRYVEEFIKKAHKHSWESQDPKTFMITRVGCGLAGYTNTDIAPMFVSAPSNCYFDLAWKYYLGDKASDNKPRKYWGSHSDQ